MKGFALRSVPAKVRPTWSILVLLILSALAPGLSMYAQSSPPSRPILFVHGWCSSADDWAPLYSSLVRELPVDSYPSTTVYYVLYDSIANTIHFWTENNPSAGASAGLTPIAESAIPLDARYFVIEFVDPNALSTDPADVTKISILNKAYEISAVIKHITAITKIPRVNILAHSMGGLDARAYVENMASVGSCYDYSNNVPKYSGTCNPGGAAYANDVANIITVDTPHTGSQLAEPNGLLGAVGLETACQADSSTNMIELRPLSLGGAGLIEALNYDGLPIGNVLPTANEVPIQAVEDYFTDVSKSWTGLMGESDDIVTRVSQAITSDTETPNANLPAGNSIGTLKNLPIPYLSSDPDVANTPGCWSGGNPGLNTPILHVMACLGRLPATQVVIASQLINDTIPWISPWTVTPATVSQGDSILVQYNASDSGGTGLTRAELWRAPDANGKPGMWEQIDFKTFNSTATEQVSFTDTPPAAGKYWYGTHLFDAAGNEALEPEPVQVTVTTTGATTAPIVFVTPLSTSLTTAQALLVAVSVDDPNGAHTPTGSVTLASGAYTSAPMSLIGGIATVTIPAGSLAAGADTLTATYVPDSTSASIFQGSSGSNSVTVSTSGTAPQGQDFSIQASPPTVSASPSGTATYLVTTATTGGTAENVTLIFGDLPSGITAASFSPMSVVSGTPSTLTLTLGSTVLTGTYTFQIFGVGSATTHSIQLTLIVSAPATGPAVTLMPPSQIFPDEPIGASSLPQTAAFRNSGSGPLRISSLSIAAGSDFGYILPSNQSFPFILNPGVVFFFQVYFLPSMIGTRTGKIYIWDNAPDSPQTMSFTGNGLAAAPSTGTIQVVGTLNGSPLPSGYGFSYTLTGPSTYTGQTGESLAVTPGPYALSFNACCDLTLSSIAPASTQTVSAGGQVMFTMNFTAPNDFSQPYFQFPAGSSTTQIVPAGATATFYPGVVYPSNTAVPITLSVTGLPPEATATFNPQPSFGGSTLTVMTDATTAPGVYALSLTGTNSDGLSHGGSNTAALIVTSPPVQPVQEVSESSTGIEANAQSSGGSVSADGRYVAFLSYATNLTPATNNDGSIYVRDLQTGTTTLASIDASGNPFLSAFESTINANGRYVAFLGATQATAGAFIRDLQLGTTERVDVATDGTPGNTTSSFPNAISADGRFVVFSSDDSNLVPGVTAGGQIYLRDRVAGKTVLVSVGIDGLPANQGCAAAVMSADGRYIAFESAATNLVTQALGGRSQLFLRDMEAGVTTLVSLAADGTVANQGVYTLSSIAMSADGRFVAFSSMSTNLVPQTTDGSNPHLFLWDNALQTTTLVDTDATGVLMGGPSGINSPSLSADGRFVTFIGYNQVLIRDMTTNQSQALSLAFDGTAGDGISSTPAISPGGTVVSFGSTSSNLVGGGSFGVLYRPVASKGEVTSSGSALSKPVSRDTNNTPEVFVASNPFLGESYVQTLALSSSSVAGGSSITGTVTLSGPAPTGGASVAIWANNSNADAPAIAFVPEGAMAGTFAIGTSVVSTATESTLVAAYNGGSAAAVLTIEPGPSIVVGPPSWNFGGQTAATTSSPQSFSIQNVGTAPLNLNSITLASGRVFHISSNQCSGTVSIGSSCSVAVVFSPSEGATASSDSLQISYGTPATIQNVELDGYGLQISTTTTTASNLNLTFSLSAQPVTLAANVTSTGGTINVGSVIFTLLSSNVAANVVNGVASVNFTVPAGQGAGMYPIQAIYNPSGNFAGSSDLTKELSIAKATPVITWVNPSDILFGTALGSTQLNATANVGGTFVYSPPAGAVLSVGNGQTLSTTFTPTDTTDYTGATANVLINVQPTSPPSSPAQIIITKALARDSNTNQVVVTLNVSNAGGTAAQNVQLTVGKINTTLGTPLPQSLGTVAAGTSATAILRFPGSVGATGAVAALIVGGTYSGGSFSTASRITLP